MVVDILLVSLIVILASSFIMFLYVIFIPTLKEKYSGINDLLSAEAHKDILPKKSQEKNPDEMISELREGKNALKSAVFYLP